MPLAAVLITIRAMVRIGLFLSSYALLFAILALRFERLELRLGSGALALLGIAAGLWIIRAENAKGPAAYTVVSSDDQGAEAASYMASYLLPFVSLAEPSLADVVGYLTFGLVAALVYTQSEMIRVNPLLYLMGRRIYRIKTETGWQAYVVARHAPVAGEQIMATTLATDVLVESRAQPNS